MPRTRNVRSITTVAVLAFAFMTAAHAPSASAAAVTALALDATRTSVYYQFSTDARFWNHQAILFRPGIAGSGVAQTGSASWKLGASGTFSSLTPNTQYRLRLKVQWTPLMPYVDVLLPPTGTSSAPVRTEP